MGLFDWLHAPPPDPGMSRRDFFARLSGRDAAEEEAPSASDPKAGTLTFHVARFPYHDGPVLVPILRAGLDFELRADGSHPTDPAALAIYHGRDLLGFVPPEHAAGVAALIAGERPVRCTALAVDPAADLARVLTVRVASGPLEPGSPESSE